MFYLHYKYNPLQKIPQYFIQKGNYLIGNAQDKLKNYLKRNDKRVKISTASLEAIHGISIIFDFKYKDFLQKNFKKTAQNWWVKYQKNGQSHYKKLKLSTWIKVINQLFKQCKTIHNYSNVSSLIRSRYQKYIILDGIKHYYHPRKIHKFKNARDRLASLSSHKRYQFAGNFVRFGSKANGQLTILLINIYYKNTLVTHHLWFNATKEFLNLGHLNVGDIIIFHARVRRYTKGYLPKTFKKKYDYQLSYPTKIHVVHV